MNVRIELKEIVYDFLISANSVLFGINNALATTEGRNHRINVFRL